jgi:cyclase
MLKKRIIPVLLLRHGRMVKGVRFANYRDTGDPVSCAKVYNSQDADELVLLDIEASVEGRGSLLRIIEKIAGQCFMPLSVGGGISSVAQVRDLLNVGADKVVITTHAFDYALIREASRLFGAQCIVCGVEVRWRGEKLALTSHCARQEEPVDLFAHLAALEAAGAGEIFLNMIDEDGRMEGYDEDILTRVRAATRLPLIVSGGAGHFSHLHRAFALGADATACASLFHFGDNNPLRAKAFLKNLGVPLKKV